MMCKIVFVTMKNIYYTITIFIVLLSSVTCSYVNLVQKYKNVLPELSYLNTSVDPCDNFYEFSCGNFKNVHPIPEGKPLWDGFQILQEKLDIITNDLISSPTSKSDCEVVKKAKAMYQSCMNLELLDHIDVSPLNCIINEFGGWPTISAETQWTFSWHKVGELISRFGIPFFFDISVKPNLYNTSENIIFISKDPVNVPFQIVFDKEFDFFNSEQSEKEDSPYTIYLSKIALGLRQNNITVSDEEILEDTRKTVSFINDIKLGTTTFKYNIPNTFDVITVEELQKWMDLTLGENYEPSLDWLTFLKQIFNPVNVKITESTRLFFVNANGFLAMFSSIAKQPPRVLNNFLMSRLMTYISPDSNEYMRQIHDEYYKPTPDYQRWKYCLRKVTDFPNLGLSLPVTQIYQKYYFNPQNIQNAREMTDDLRTAFGEILDEVNWMDDKEKLLAKYKLQQMLVLIGYPDMLNKNCLIDEQFASLKICKHDLLGNVNRLRLHIYHENLKTLYQTKDKTIWEKSPLYVNAFYYPSENKVSFPIGLMNPPFFTGEESFIDYGRIGTFLGHEITHGFDSQGRLYDANGNLNLNLKFNETTLAMYQKKEQCFRDQYSKYIIPQLNVPVNANKTLSENIADNGGLRESYKAYQKLKDRLLYRKKSYYKNIEDFTSDQLFFISYGTMWCRQITFDQEKYMYLYDNHAPNQFRVNGPVSNYDKFAEAFNCDNGSNMNPKNKCVLW